MKRILTLSVILMSIGQVPAQSSAIWLEKVSFFNAEDVLKIEYVPGQATIPARVWTYADAFENIGTGSHPNFVYEYRLAAYNAADGSAVFSYPVVHAALMEIAYAASSEEVLVLLKTELASGSIQIGSENITVASSPSGCTKFALLKYDKEGNLLNVQWLEYPCTHQTFVSIATIQAEENKIAITQAVFGDAASDLSTFSFGSFTKQLSSDSSYTSVFEWNFEGEPLKAIMFDQTRAPSRTGIHFLDYGTNGDLYLSGLLKDDITMGTTTLSREANEGACFMARMNSDGNVVVAEKVFNSFDTTLYSYTYPRGMTFNPYNNHIYFVTSWSSQVILNDTTIREGSYGSSNLLLLQIDSNLVRSNFNMIRYMDTTATAYSKIVTYDNFHADEHGNLIIAASILDSLIVGDADLQYNTNSSQYKSAFFKFDAALNFDTCYVSSGSGDVQPTVFASGEDKHIYVGGKFSGENIFAPLPAAYPASSNRDAYVVKIKIDKETPASIQEDLSTSQRLYIYPNPTSGMLYIEASGIVNIKVYNIAGKLLENRKTNPSDPAAHIPTYSLVPGYYFLEITDKEDRKYYAKFIKKK